LLVNSLFNTFIFINISIDDFNLNVLI